MKQRQSPFIQLHFLLLLTLVPVGTLYAQAGAQITGFRDHPLLRSFPDSDIVDMEFLQDVNYRMVLGSLQRTRGEVVPEDSQRYRGDLSKINYEVSDEFSGDDVFQFYTELIETEGYSRLFTCSGRACGSSNYWANDIFKNRVLYGPERNQHYIAFSIQADGVEAYVALYIITRGNRKVYAYLELMEVGGSESDSQELLGDLQQQGSVIIPGLRFDSEDRLDASSNLSLLLAVLEANPEIRVYLVSHLQATQSVQEQLANKDSLEVLLTRSNKRATSLRQALISRGIDPLRLNAQGVGPLAPGCTQLDCADRVELVPQ